MSRKKKWIVCKNSNGMYYAMKTKASSIYEHWDSNDGIFHDAVYGPCTKQDASDFVNDMVFNNLKFIIPGKPNRLTMFFNDFPSDDDDDYEGKISFPKG